MHDRAADRIYLFLPGHVRAHDHDQGGPLQALLRILTRELDLVDADIQRLYDNWFIETCDDWVVSYIGDLVGARPLRSFGEGGGSLRGYVANTLGYRQAKGTIAVVEQLARDVTGWPAHAVEFFRRLAQTQHMNHVRLENVATMSLRDADAAAQTGSPFETGAHLVDVRPDGRYNIPNVGVFLWRLQSVYLPFLFADDAEYRGGVQPARSAAGDGFLHLDPLGRDVPMFNPARTEPALAHLAQESDLPGPLRRRPVHEDLEALRAGRPGAGAYFDAQPVFRVRLDGHEVGPAELHSCNLEDIDDGAGGIVWRRPAEPGHVFFDPELGRMSLHAADENASVEAAWAYAAAHDLGGGAYDRRSSIDTWMEAFHAAAGDGSLWQIGVTRRQSEVTGNVNRGGPVVSTLAAAFDDWNAAAAEGARGIITVLDSASYDDDLTGDRHVLRIPAGATLAIVAAGWPADEEGGARRRRLGVLAPQDRRPFVASGLRVWGIAGTPPTGCEPRHYGADPADESGAGREGGTLVLDGLLVGGTVTVTDGDLGRLEIRHCTVGAGIGELSPGLIVGRGNERLQVSLDHTITGAVDLGDAAASLVLADTVVGQDASANPDPASVPPIVTAHSADLDITRSTIFGLVVGRTLHADATIFAGPPWIARRQQGCIRFSYVPAGARVPRSYRCAPELTLEREKERLGRELSAEETARIRARLRPLFTSSLFGDPAFAQLASSCAVEISEGADQGGEMGAMNALGNPARVANLGDALIEYLPLGLRAGIVFVT